MILNIHITDIYFSCDILQFNICNIIVVNNSNQFNSLGGSWCQMFEMMTLCLCSLTVWTRKQ